MIRSNKLTINFYNHLINNEKVKKGEKLFEQSYIQQELKLFAKNITLKELSLNEYQNGCMYFNKYCNFFHDEIKSIYTYIY